LRPPRRRFCPQGGCGSRLRAFLFSMRRGRLLRGHQPVCAASKSALGRLVHEPKIQ